MGDAAIGTRTLLIGELLCESVDLHAGERVLDVPCGSGSAALAAARRFCRVVGVDVPERLGPARRRAQAEGLEVAFLEGKVERPGGRIGMVAWTPDGYVGELFAAIGRHLPWGTKERLCELLGPEVAITAPRRSFLWRFPSAEHQVAFLASFHDPTAEALQALEPDRADALKVELLEVARRFDVSEDDTLVLRLDYLEAVVRKPVWL
jgi:SAM-dependent methyltransferase